MRLGADVMHEARILPVFIQVGFADNVAAFHRPVLLGVGQGAAFAREGDFCAGGDGRCRRGESTVGIEAGALPHPPGLLAAIAQREDDGVVGKPRLDVDRSAHHAPVDSDLTDMGHLLAAHEFGFLHPGDL